MPSTEECMNLCYGYVGRSSALPIVWGFFNSLQQEKTQQRVNGVTLPYE